MQELGVVTKVRRYPVKSMAGENPGRVRVNFTGLTGDRVYALIIPGGPPSFPWLTARQKPSLLEYQPRFAQPLDPEVPYPTAGNLRVIVRSKDGEEHDVDDPKFLDALRSRFNRDFELRFTERGMHDTRPVSIIGEATIAELGREVGQALDPRRFRANFYVKWASEAPFFEDGLVGKQLRIGNELTVFVTQKDIRCKIITLDPDTTDEDGAVLTCVREKHGKQTGVYAIVVREGIVEEGAPVSLV